MSGLGRFLGAAGLGFGFNIACAIFLEGALATVAFFVVVFVILGADLDLGAALYRENIRMEPTAMSLYTYSYWFWREAI